MEDGESVGEEGVFEEDAWDVSEYYGDEEES